MPVTLTDSDLASACNAQHKDRALRTAAGVKTTKNPMFSEDGRLRTTLEDEVVPQERFRTPDPIITNDVLYQLSYCGDPIATRWRSMGRRLGHFLRSWQHALGDAGGLRFDDCRERQRRWSQYR